MKIIMEQIYGVIKVNVRTVGKIVVVIISIGIDHIFQSGNPELPLM